MLAIIDFGYGNIESVRNMFQKIGEKILYWHVLTMICRRQIN